MSSFPYQRIVVIGTTSSGKSTLAARLANRLHMDFIELDALHWEPNWQEAPLEDFPWTCRKSPLASRTLDRRRELSHCTRSGLAQGGSRDLAGLLAVEDLLAAHLSHLLALVDTGVAVGHKPGKSLYTFQTLTKCVTVSLAVQNILEEKT